MTDGPAERVLVTAIVPSYNSAEFIERTLACLVEQTWEPLEILIGDDASSDRTPQIIADFAKQHANVTVVQREENLGWLRNTNDLMSRATGDLMFFAFHDDLVAPTYVERLVAALRDRPDAVLAFSDMTVTDTDGREQVYAFEALEHCRTTLERGFTMSRRPTDWWVPNRGLFRASAYRDVGGIHPNDSGEFSADWTWLLSLALRGAFVRVPEVLCDKFYKAGSLSKSWAHDDRQRRALNRAGLAEIRRGPLGPVDRALLLAAAQDRVRIPVWLRRAGRRLAVRVRT